MRKYLVPIIAAVITALTIATFAIAQPGIGITKTAPLAGTGSTASPLRITPCAEGEVLETTGGAWTCVAGGCYAAGVACTGNGDCCSLSCSGGFCGGLITAGVNIDVSGSEVSVEPTVTLLGEANIDTLEVFNEFTDQTSSVRAIDAQLAGTFAATVSTYAARIENISEPSDPEAVTLTNYALYANAANADGANYSGYFDNGSFQVNGPATFSGADVSSSPGVNSVSTAADTEGRTMVQAVSSGVITTGVASSLYGFLGSVTNTRSGAGTLTNYGAHLTASGADANYALWTEAGSVNFEGATTVDDNLTVTGNHQVDGNTTIGNAAADTLTVNATTTLAGPTGRIKGVTEAINTAGGTQSDLAVGYNTSIVKYTTTAGANTTLTGIAISGGNEDGDILFFTIGANIVVTVAVETTSTAANRISSQGDASDFTFRGPTTLMFVYDGTLSRFALSPVANRLPGLIVGNDSTLGDSNNDVTSVRNFKDSSTAPTLSSCGTSPTVTGGSNAFVITAGTGGITACTATFANTKTNAPACTVSIRDVVEGVYLSSVSATAITITAQTGTTDLSSNVIDVICIGDA